MNDWTSGYVADIGYTYGYYTELNPLRAELAFLNAGIAAPPRAGVHCELGYGQGISVNIHAASSASQWFATDFNPSQSAFAQSIASVTGADAHLVDQGFAEFCARKDLPDFDSIGLHGIWSWISDENRAVIVEFVRKKLKVGGALFISYNTLPGWSSFAPMRFLMTQHAEVMGSRGAGVLSRVEGALNFAQKLIDTNPMYAKANPQVGDRLAKIKVQDKHYLAHEYFNRDWHPMHFADMEKWLSPAKLSYACSANYLDHIPAINLTSDQQALLKEIPDRALQETVRDFMVNQQFRRDYWVKGPRKLSSIEHAQAIRSHSLVLVNYRPEIVLKVNGSLGQSDLNPSFYDPILDELSDHKPKTFGQLEDSLKDKGITTALLMQAIMVLVGNGPLCSAQEEQKIREARPYSDKLNKLMINKAQGSGDVGYFASPVTGGGIGVNRFQQIFLLTISQGKQQPIELAQSVWQILSSQGQKIVKEGKTLETDQENLDELIVQANDFLNKQLPILRALQVA
jgi:hypothetical protein